MSKTNKQLFIDLRSKFDVLKHTGCICSFF